MKHRHPFGYRLEVPGSGGEVHWVGGWEQLCTMWQCCRPDKIGTSWQGSGWPSEIIEVDDMTGVNWNVVTEVHTVAWVGGARRVASSAARHKVQGKDRLTVWTNVTWRPQLHVSMARISAMYRSYSTAGWRRRMILFMSFAFCREDAISLYAMTFYTGYVIRLDLLSRIAFKCPSVHWLKGRRWL